MEKDVEGVNYLEITKRQENNLKERDRDKDGKI